ncbi:hypothetical protein TWF481_008427 [Arthrobotrys musiformis]|uniref:Uncharacterized protein n=1 Tax=Arthrobotrys musiformis TaxID=47236 RepID=A0AAV9W935_9PEZI
MEQSDIGFAIPERGSRWARGNSTEEPAQEMGGLHMGYWLRPGGMYRDCCFGSDYILPGQFPALLKCKCNCKWGVS